MEYQRSRFVNISFKMIRSQLISHFKQISLFLSESLATSLIPLTVTAIALTLAGMETVCYLREDKADLVVCPAIPQPNIHIPSTKLVSSKINSSRMLLTRVSFYLEVMKTLWEAILHYN